MKILLQSLDIDLVIYFTGSDEEILEAEKKEARRAAEIESLIFSGTFRQLTYTTETGQIHTLHHSTRPGVMLQLSFIDRNGVPVMHENYIKTAPETVNEFIHTKRDLLQHYVRKSLYKTLHLELIID